MTHQEHADRARTGVYGGTFNPIHIGHLRAAEEVRELLGLERMLFVPSARPPHKRAGDGDPIAPAEARLAWVREAIADNERFEVDPLELEREGPSYLVDTLRELRDRRPDETPVFVLGCDAFFDLPEWREPDRLVALAHFAVTTRPPRARGALGEWIPEGLRRRFEVAPDGLSARHRDAGTWVRLLEITPFDVSASAIRARLRTGRSVRYLLPERVHDPIVSSGVYRARDQDQDPNQEGSR